MSEGKKNLKNLRDRLGVNKEGANSGETNVPVGVNLPPVVGPPGVTLPPNIGSPMVAPPGLELPAPPQSAVSQPLPVAPVYFAPEPPKPVVIKGSIEDDISTMAGLNSYGTLKKVLVTSIPLVIFAFVGHIIGNMVSEGNISSKQKEETSVLWKKVRSQDEAITKLDKAIELTINQKMKVITPDSVAKDAADFYKNINPKEFYPDDGLFLATTPLIDNNKKDTDPRFVIQLLEYIDITSQFLVRAQLNAIITERDKANLDTGFKKILTRVVELSSAEADPAVKEVVGGIGVLTNAPYKGYGIELIENSNKARLVIIKEIEKDDDKKNKSYTVYDAKYGATAPPATEKDAIKKIEDKTKVAVIDQRNARTFLLTRETFAVENFFTTLFHLKGASINIRKNREEAANALENALKAPQEIDLESTTPKPATPAPTPAAEPGDAPEPADPATPAPKK
jgi:hypothetical protein